MKNKITTILAITFSTVLAAQAQIAQGGVYKLDQSVIASGGGTSADQTGNVYSITGAVGQPVAGNNASNPPYAVQSGFFTAAPLAPTAAPATIGGRILTANERGIRNVVVMLTDSRGVSRTATSTAFGYFQFHDVTAGEVYVLSVRAKQFQFEQSSFTVLVNENVTDLRFVALPK